MLSAPMHSKNPPGSSHAASPQQPSSWWWWHVCTATHTCPPSKAACVCQQGFTAGYACMLSHVVACWRMRLLISPVNLRCKPTSKEDLARARHTHTCNPCALTRARGCMHTCRAKNSVCPSHSNSPDRPQHTSPHAPDNTTAALAAAVATTGSHAPRHSRPTDRHTRPS
jgi:hypothetical protein